MTNVRWGLLFATCMAMAAYSDPAAAREAMSTFASFYDSPVGISWLTAGLVALAIGIVVLIGWPVLGAPTIAVVGSIGTAIGNLFGLSGIAATNFGLALLGGGSIVSGGFGIAGGTAILAAALSFGTDVTLDYAVGKASSRYQAAQFVRYSKSMMTLPVPANTNGSESVEAAGKARLQVTQ